MRLQFYLLALPLFLFATSCESLVAIRENDFIVFSTSTSTRGQKIESSDELFDFGVFGIEISAEEYTPQFMYNQKVERIEDLWVYSPSKTWPNNTYASIDFYAYAPYSTSSDGVTLSGEQYEGTPYISYKSLIEVTLQQDLMIGQTSINTATGEVNIEFFHALAAISFTIEGNDASRVDSIAVSGIVDEGIIDLVVSQDNTLSWRDLSDVSETEYIVSGSESLFVIPQGVNSSTSLTLYIDGEPSEYNFPDNTSWQSGNHYNYYIEVDDGIIELEGIENCYMIDPAEGLTYSFDATTRVNQFWGDQANGGVDARHPLDAADGDGYTAIGSRTNCLSDTDKWYMEVIWSDINSSNPITFNQTQENYGVGYEDVTFTLDTHSYGNILIGLKKRGSEDYLWSWHLWLTNYDPDATDSTVTLPLESEMVEDFINMGREIMDRNLGARNSGQSEDSYGLYYQWGRKDPFYSTAYYPTSSSSPETSTSGSLILTVLNPQIFYYTDTTPFGIYATTSAALDYNRWGGSRSSITAECYENDKTIYDPCPKGWRVPAGKAWAGFTSGECDMNSGWITYNSNIFAPAGMRVSIGGEEVLTGTSGNYWSASADQENDYAAPVFCMTWTYYYVDTRFREYQSDNRAGAYSIRPIRMK